MSDDIVAQLRLWAEQAKEQDATDVVIGLCQAADMIESFRKDIAARCGDARPGAHTAGPSETFIPEAL
jgi:hypothetical protein